MAVRFTPPTRGRDSRELEAPELGSRLTRGPALAGAGGRWRGSRARVARVGGVTPDAA